MLLFDEPLSNLDAKLRVQMRAEIKSLHHRLKTTVVYVTHDQVEAMTMADTSVVPQDGRVEQAGSPLDLYDRPANAFVATLIGSPAMNLLPGTVEHGGGRDGGRDGGPHVLAGGGVRLPLPPTAHVAAGTPVLYGIRPEHLAPAEAGSGPEAEVAVVEPTGSETHVLLRLGGEQVNGVFRERVANRPGERLHLRPVPEKVHLFAQDGGQRLDA